ncbi:MAG: RES family NAD+ phosphorylase [Limisphaerales bacterium]
MKPAANPRYETFLLELGKLKRPFIRWKGLLFRASPLKYARAAKLLDGKGSFRHGGRWSAAGTFPANNSSTAPETAVSESSAGFTYYNFALSDVRPRVLVAVRVSLSRVLDLVAPKGIRSKPWLELDELLAEDWRKINNTGYEAGSHALARAGHDLGAEGLLVPSARVAGAMNLVYFPESLGTGSKVEILGEDELDRWLKQK